MIGFLTSRLGIAVLAGAAVLVILAWVYLEAYQAGAASAALATALEGIRRAQAAQRARSEVNQSEDAIRNDPHNRDSR